MSKKIGSEIVVKNEGRWRLEEIRLETEHLLIRPFTELDINSSYLNWFNDAQHMRFSNQRFREHTASSALRYLSEFDFFASDLLAVEHIRSGQLAGTATVFATADYGTADLGVLVGPEFCGQGFAKEVVRSLADSLIQQGFRKVTIGTSARNGSMLKVIAAVGFEVDGVKAKQELINGQETDLLYFALFGTPKDS